MEYIGEEKSEGCIFCEKSKDNDDEKNLIVYRGVHSFVMLNLYPYNPGHIMIAPYSHKAGLSDLEVNESADLMTTLNRAIEALRSSVSPDGLNIGINLGAVAGAGVIDHIHVHAVPRWLGDTNFMPVLADAKVIPEHLKQTWVKLKEKFDKD